MRMMLFGLACLSALVGCSAATSFPLSIPRDPTAAAQIERAVAWVASDRPDDRASEEALVANALIDMSTWPSCGHRDSPQQEATRVRLWRELGSGEIKSARFLTDYQSKPVWHQVTVGAIDLPYIRFVARFDPAADWGRNLASYRGGEVVVDQRGADGLAVLQRERMVLGTPWYALGAPDLDMEKVEAMSRSAGSTRVSWVVTASPNASVQVDVGYLLFREVLLGDRHATLVAFNSIHRIETGFVGFDSFVVGDNIAAAFTAHIERYRRVAGN